MFSLLAFMFILFLITGCSSHKKRRATYKKVSKKRLRNTQSCRCGEDGLGWRISEGIK